MLHAIVRKLRIIILIKGLERKLRGGITGLMSIKLICRRGTGVMRIGGSTERLIGSSTNSRTDHHHQRLGVSPSNSQNQHLLMVLVCDMGRQLLLLSLRKHFQDQSPIQVPIDFLAKRVSLVGVNCLFHGSWARRLGRRLMVTEVRVV